jgi:hypothetical protein
MEQLTINAQPNAPVFRLSSTSAIDFCTTLHAWLLDDDLGCTIYSGAMNTGEGSIYGETYLDMEAIIRVMKGAGSNLVAQLSNSARVADIAYELEQLMNAHAPAYCYFGAVQSADKSTWEWGYWVAEEQIAADAKSGELRLVPQVVKPRYCLVESPNMRTLYLGNDVIWSVED